MMFNWWGSCCHDVYKKYLCVFVCVCELLAWIHILSGYTTLYRGDFFSASSPDRELCRQDWRFLPKAQSSILNAPPLGCLAVCSLLPSLWETKLYYYTWFALIGLLHILRACIWKISTHAHVRRLVLVPELIMGNEYVLPTSSCKAFLPRTCIHY